MMSSESMSNVEFANVHEALIAHARTSPDQVALIAEDGRTLTYAQLCDAVARAQRTLRDAGVVAGERVALVAKNSIETAVAYLAITVANAAVPLNPGYRDDEYSFYFDDLKVRALIQRDAEVACAVARRDGLPIISLDSLADAVTDSSTSSADGPTGVPQDANAVALVLHTSGTTSRPKIVPLTHANVFSACAAIAQTLELGTEDRCLNVMATYHVHGLSAVLASLIAGGSVVCPEEFVAPDFFPLVHQHAATWYTASPTIHRAVLEWAQQQPTPFVHSLRFVRSASAPMPTHLIGDIETALGVPFLEAYGMTEAAPMIATNLLPPAERKVGSVGRAAGCEVAIMLDGALVPAGANGEVVVRGPNLMHAYENDERANEAAFVDSWFRTGDMGVLDADGYLSITGRLKEIINRGGEKIAPQEVDRVLLSHPDVASAVTFPVPHPKLGEEVAALVVLHPNAAATPRELQDHVAEQLADFKVPRHIEIRASIPVDGSGKLKRDALAEVLGLADVFGTTELAALAEFSLARTPNEEMLASIWEEVLKQERISIYDDFFALGGDSILAAQALMRSNDALGTEFTFLDFFENPTIAQLASRTFDDRPAWLNPPPVERAPDDAVLPLSVGQEALFVMQLLNPNDASNNVYRAIRMRGALNVEALIQSVNELVARHDSLRTTYVEVDGAATRRISAYVRVDVPITDLGNVPEARREAMANALVERDARAPFDLATGPLFRARIFRVNEHDHILLLTMHHIMMDGWSSGILFSELEVLYSAFSQQHRSPLREPALRHADYCYWQRERLVGQLAEHLNEYWRTRLAGAPSSLALPFDHERPALLKRTGDRVSFNFEGDVVAKTKRIARAENATLYMGLLAAFKLMLVQYSDQTDMVVGSPISGRDRPELESLVGYFSNSLVMRTQLDGDVSFQEAIRRVRATVIDAHAHHELPFASVVAAVGDARTLNQNPLFQVNFRLRNIPVHEIAMPGLAVESVDMHNGMAKFELAFEMWEDGPNLVGFSEFSDELFTRETITTMVTTFEQMLHTLASQPSAPWRSLTNNEER